jgi:peptide-methionine (R)-S-oxide reductase
MLDRRRFVVSTLALAACWKVSPETAVEAGTKLEGAEPSPGVTDLPKDPDKITPLVLTDEQWKQKLTADAYHVLREAGTERAFTGRYADYHGPGRFLCAGCGLALFDASTKFESGTGWPSFYQPLKPDRVTTNEDLTLGISRDEVRCARCAGHLGHVFPDGPPPTGLRYCMNSVSLVLEPKV